MNDKVRRGIYILPNLITTANLCSGFYSVMLAMSGRYEYAALAIFVAMLFDAMDGRVARLTNTQSAFGVQYDSLSDMMSFGVAPAILIYSYTLGDLGRWGWVAAFIYVAGAALRLARFNVNVDVVDSRFFQGLPSPSAAALTAGFVWMSVDNRLPLVGVHSWIAFVITVYAGLTMISNAPFWSGKSAMAKERKSPALLMAVLVVIFALILVNPATTVMVLFLAYTLSGWVVFFVRGYLARRLHKQRKGQTVA